ncbi:MAG: leucine-rich repeat domain-containing protein [Bacteroidales bacterium]|jgi:hypothetical protein|nr:leucine-rich repeat domain-containing protein [Bacteroidales bacterium]
MKKLFLILTVALCFCAANKATAQVVASGQTGDCTWTLTGPDGNYTLTISGTGAMEDYVEESPPWYSYQNSIRILIIEQGVTTIGDRAFAGCSDLTGALTIPNSVMTIGDMAFFNCFGLTGSLIIPNSVTTIGEYTFYSCNGFTSVTTGNSVTTIGYYAFSACHGLTSVTVGNSVTTIGESAFYNCDGLTEMYVQAATPPSVSYGAFDSVPKSIPVYVCGSVEAYQNASRWREFTNIVYGCVGIEDVSLENGVTLYPNPATDYINIVLPEHVSYAGFTLCDMQGRVLIRREIGNRAEISVGGLAAGVYLYNMTTERQQYRGKIVIRN